MKNWIRRAKSFVEENPKETALWSILSGVVSGIVGVIAYKRKRKADEEAAIRKRENEAKCVMIRRLTSGYD